MPKATTHDLVDVLVLESCSLHFANWNNQTILLNQYQYIKNKDKEVQLILFLNVVHAKSAGEKVEVMEMQCVMYWTGRK